jgi:hypothetical protein
MFLKQSWEFEYLSRSADFFVDSGKQDALEATWYSNSDRRDI